MTVTVNLTSHPVLAATGRGLPIHICISGQSTNLARAIGDFDRATAG
jgi:hypothetical protein